MDLLQVMERFPDQEACITHLEKICQDDTPTCRLEENRQAIERNRLAIEENRQAIHRNREEIKNVCKVVEGILSDKAA